MKSIKRYNNFDSINESSLTGSYKKIGRQLSDMSKYSADLYEFTKKVIFKLLEISGNTDNVIDFVEEYDDNVIAGYFLFHSVEIYPDEDELIYYLNGEIMIDDGEMVSFNNYDLTHLPFSTLYDFISELIIISEYEKNLVNSMSKKVNESLILEGFRDDIEKIRSYSKELDGRYERIISVCKNIIDVLVENKSEVIISAVSKKEIRDIDFFDVYGDAIEIDNTYSIESVTRVDGGEYILKGYMRTSPNETLEFNDYLIDYLPKSVLVDLSLALIGQTDYKDLIRKNMSKKVNENIEDRPLLGDSFMTQLAKEIYDIKGDYESNINRLTRENKGKSIDILTKIFKFLMQKSGGNRIDIYENYGDSLHAGGYVIERVYMNNDGCISLRGEYINGNDISEVDIKLEDLNLNELTEVWKSMSDNDEIRSEFNTISFPLSKKVNESNVLSYNDYRSINENVSKVPGEDLLSKISNGLQSLEKEYEDKLEDYNQKYYEKALKTVTKVLTYLTSQIDDKYIDLLDIYDQSINLSNDISIYFINNINGNITLSGDSFVNQRYPSEVELKLNDLSLIDLVGFYLTVIGIDEIRGMINSVKTNISKKVNE